MLQKNFKSNQSFHTAVVCNWSAATRCRRLRLMEIKKEIQNHKYLCIFMFHFVANSWGVYLISQLKLVPRRSFLCFTR